MTPFFMFGFERSGTTLLSMMVGAHPLIAVPFSVTGMWYRYNGCLSEYNDISNRLELERLVDDLLSEPRIGLWDINLSRKEILQGLTPGNFASVVTRFHQAYAAGKSKPFWGNIDIATIYHMDSAHKWFPDARFIHIIRDGRDVALSHETYPYGVSNTLECAFKWDRTVACNLKMGAMLNPHQYMVLRYEDLIRDCENTLKRLCKFLKVAYSPAMMDYYTMVENKIPNDKRYLWPSLNQEPVAANAYRWKSEMPMVKRIVFESNAGTLLKHLGYEVFNQVPRKPSAYLLELWHFIGLGDRFKRLAAKFGRIGTRT